jgi:hypothetical protein
MNPMAAVALNPVLAQRRGAFRRGSVVHMVTRAGRTACGIRGPQVLLFEGDDAPACKRCGRAVRSGLVGKP